MECVPRTQTLPSRIKKNGTSRDATKPISVAGKITPLFNTDSLLHSGSQGPDQQSFCVMGCGAAQSGRKLSTFLGELNFCYSRVQIFLGSRITVIATRYHYCVVTIVTSSRSKPRTSKMQADRSAEMLADFRFMCQNTIFLVLKCYELKYEVRVQNKKIRRH